MRKPTSTAIASAQAHGRAPQLQETGERPRGLPVAGMPLDIVLAVDRLTPEKMQEVRRLVTEMWDGSSGRGYHTYSEDDLERLRALVSELERSA